MPQFASPAATNTATTSTSRWPVRPLTASSSAYFARYGGGGPPSRAAARSPRGLCAHGRAASAATACRSGVASSATTSRRPSRRAPASSARRPDALSRDFLHVAARLDCVRELLLEEPVVIDLAVDRARRDELVVR